MANASRRFYGEVGYAPTVIDDHGVAKTSIIKRNYYGDVLEQGSKWRSAEKVNDDISAEERISIVADPYAIQNFPYIRYVIWMGTRWKVTHIKVAYPRIILTLGGVYNGDQV